MPRTRRVYTEEFKRDIVNIYLSSNKTYKELSSDVGVNASTICQWKTELEKKGDLSFSGHGLQKLSPDQEEVKRLKKELSNAKLERDILKKALAIFSQQ